MASSDLEWYPPSKPMAKGKKEKKTFKVLQKKRLISETADEYHHNILRPRSGKTEQLLIDVITDEPYLNSAFTSGLKTDYPFLWLRALEEALDFATADNVVWYNTFDDNDKIFECQIQFHQNTNRIATIHVYLTTGVLLIKGKNRNTIIANFFPLLKDFYEKLVVNSKLALDPDTVQLPVSPIQTSAVHTNSTPQIGILNPTLVTSSTSCQNEDFSHQDEDSISILQEIPADCPDNAALLENIDDFSVAGIFNSSADLFASTLLQSSDETPSICSVESALHEMTYVAATHTTPVGAFPATTVPPVYTTSANTQTTWSTSLTMSSSIYCAPSSNDINVPHMSSTPVQSQAIPESNNQVMFLLKENKKIRASFENIQNGISNVTSQLSNFRTILTDKTTEFTDGLSKLENRFDEKISAFESLLNDNWHKKLVLVEEKLTQNFNKSISVMQNKIGEFKMGVYNDIRALQSSNKSCDHEQKLLSLEQKVDKVDIPSLNSMSDLLETALGRIDSLKQDNISLRKDLDLLKKNPPASVNQRVTPPQQHNRPASNSGNSNDRSDSAPQRVIPPQQQNRPAFNSGNSNDRSHTAPQANEVVLFMDSNRKILDSGRLWDPKKSTLVHANSLTDILRVLPNYVTRDSKCVVIHCGTNDIDRLLPTEVCDLMAKIIDNIAAINPDIRVVLSELLPRCDDMDECVKMVNSTLESFYGKDKYVFALSNDKFRQFPNNYMVDERHLKREAAPLFASGLKYAIRACMPSKSMKKVKRNEPSSGGKVSEDLCSRLVKAIKSCF